MTATENQPPIRRVATIEAKAEQARLTDAARIEQDARRAELDLQHKQAEFELQQKRSLAHEEEKEKRRTARGEKRAKRLKKLDDLAPVIGRRTMITGPIVAPMTVAWIGQIGFALDTLHWNILGALVFAAAWELSTAFNGWMYHQARDDGDAGTIFRVATWLFAGGAGLMNYWHALPKGGDLTDPTPKAASFGVMSLSGIALWELYTLLIHRKKLRKDGKLPEPRPRFGAARWTQFPRTTWIARSLSIRDGHITVDAAWTAARAQLNRHARVRSAKKVARAGARAGRAPINLTVIRGPRTRVSVAPLTTWTQPPVVWVPTVGPRVTPNTKTHPAVAAGSTPESTREATLGSTPESTPEPMVRRAVRTTPETTSESTPEPTRETTAEPMGGTTPETTPEPTDESTSESTPRTTRRTTRGRGKGRRRTRDELRVELEQKVAEHYRNGGGEIQVKPLAEELKATRKTVRELLDEMNVRPIRKASG